MGPILVFPISIALTSAAPIRPSGLRVPGYFAIWTSCARQPASCLAQSLNTKDDFHRIYHYAGIFFPANVLFIAVIIDSCT